MKTSHSLQRSKVVPFLLSLLLASVAGVTSAQAVKAEAPLSRAQVKMERDEFMRTHRYDQVTDNWVMRPEMEAPEGSKSRAEIKADRDVFLRNHRFDPVSDTWISLEGKPRDMSKMTRQQVREETRQFVRTHMWDDISSTWVLKPVVPKKKGS